jgi:hypothetical protein
VILHSSHLRTLLYIFVNDMDDLKTYHSVKNTEDCKPLLYDMDSLQKWCLDNGIVTCLRDYRWGLDWYLGTLNTYWS